MLGESIRMGTGGVSTVPAENERRPYRRLGFAERVSLVHDLWDSIAAEQQGFELAAESKTELNRRLAAYRADRNPGSPWPEVKSRILSKLGRVNR